MKNLRFLSFLLLVLGFVACNNADKQYIASLEAEAEKAKGMSASIDGLLQQFKNLQTRLNNDLPVEIKNSENPTMLDLSSRFVVLIEKAENIQKENNETIEKLKALAADHNAGKITVEEAKKQSDILIGNMQSTPEAITRLTEVAKRCNASIDELIASGGKTTPAKDAMQVPAASGNVDK